MALEIEILRLKSVEALFFCKVALILYMPFDPHSYSLSYGSSCRTPSSVTNFDLTY
jgi:hypothetical protein